MVGFRVLGVALTLVGIWLLLDSFVRFAWHGLGTPAPVAPARHLVVTGLYRFVRNPMYPAVVAAIFGAGSVVRQHPSIALCAGRLGRMSSVRDSL
jgi:protein-S-isoprenylcysteine O-methyltransferase Ste14